MARLALGGVAHKPWRSAAAEAALAGQAPSPAAFAAAAELALAGAAGYGHNDFKIELARRSIVRALGSGGGRHAAVAVRQKGGLGGSMTTSSELASTYTGQPLSRIDGPLKVSGRAPYAADYPAPGPAAWGDRLEPDRLRPHPFDRHRGGGRPPGRGRRLHP